MEFLSHNDVVYGDSSFNDACLARVNDRRHHFIESIRKDFDNDFIEYSAKRDRPEVKDLRSMHLLGYEDNNSGLHKS